MENTQVDERKVAEESHSERSCPECSGSIVRDEEHGEKTCKQCGLVLDERRIDRGPEWRAFDSNERDEKSRVGSPTTGLIHDKGLSTKIGWQDKDANGQTVADRKRARLQRLRTWDERYRVKDAQERNLKQALGEITRMSCALDLPDFVEETAATVYRQGVDKDLLVGRSIEGMATAALYAAARQHGTPRPLWKFSEVSRVEKARIRRAYRYTSRELGLRIEPADPLEYVPQFASTLGISDEATRQAQDLLVTAKTEAIHSGKSPAGLAAAAIYASSHLTNEQLTQETVSNRTNISKVVIRKRYQELLDVYEEKSHSS